MYPWLFWKSICRYAGLEVLGLKMCVPTEQFYQTNYLCAALAVPEHVYVDQGGLELTKIHVLLLPECYFYGAEAATMPGSKNYFSVFLFVERVCVLVSHFCCF